MIEPNKNYITQAGYVVQFGDNHWWSKNKVPYVLSYGKPYLDGSIAFWNKDGAIPGVTSEWAEKLRIVSEFDHPIPQLPEGYRWKDGFIQFRLPKTGEYYYGDDDDIHVADYDYKAVSKFVIEPYSQKEKKS